MRKHLLQDFTQIYHLDLHGNVRKNPKLSGTTHNVFGIQVGAGITVAVRKAGAEKFLKYYRVPENWRKGEKLAWLAEKEAVKNIDWQTLQPDNKQNWITEGMQSDFEEFFPLGTKEGKASSGDAQTVFKTFSPGVNTARDSVAYSFNQTELLDGVTTFFDSYNADVRKWSTNGRPKDIDNFVDYNTIKWSEHLKNELQRERYAEVDPSKCRIALYRPFSKKYLYYDRLLNDRPGLFTDIFPPIKEAENLAIGIAGLGADHWTLFCTDSILDYKCGISGNAGTRCFPLYTYADNGAIRRDNVTDWALTQFQEKYGPDVTKRDIFHYVYGLLHSPEYRERYKENLKRELPRIPLVGGEPTPQQAAPLPKGEGKEGGAFTAFVAAGEALAALHIGYEEAEEYPLTQLVNKDVPFTWRVTKMRLNKEKTALVINEALTLGGIPPEVYDYKLGNRSALEWVIDQYQVSTDKRSGIVTDPNRADDPEYIVRLVRRVVTVSLKTRSKVLVYPH